MKFGWLICLSCISVLMSAAIMYGLSFRYLSSNSADWANFGNYYGGLCGPLLSFVSIVLLLVTLRNQADTYGIMFKQYTEAVKASRIQSGIIAARFVNDELQKLLLQACAARPTVSIKKYYFDDPVLCEIPAVDSCAASHQLREICETINDMISICSVLLQQNETKVQARRYLQRYNSVCLRLVGGGYNVMASPLKGE